MFKRCFACLLPRSCLHETATFPGLPQGFFTGKVLAIEESNLILSLNGPITNDKEEQFSVPRSRNKRANVGDLCYVLKRDEIELVTVPAVCPEDELMCCIVAITGEYIVLNVTPNKELCVFPCPYLMKDPVRYINRHALLVRGEDGVQYDIVLEDGKVNRTRTDETISGMSEVPLMVTEESILEGKGTERSPERTPGRGIAEHRRKRALYIDTSENQDFSFSHNMSVPKENENPPSLHSLGDSSEYPRVNPLALPESTISEDTSFKPRTSYRSLKLNPYSDQLPSSHTQLISRDRLPLDLLQPGISLKQIEDIGDKASAWRRVNKDKNSFFRCIAVSWMEHLARITTGLNVVDQTVSSLINPVNSAFEIRPGFEETVEKVEKLMAGLRDNKERNRTSALAYLQPEFQNRENVQCLERYLRMICVNYREKINSTPELSPILPEDFSRKTAELAESGTDSSSLTYMSLMDPLCFSLCILSTDDQDDSINVEEYRAEETGDQEFEVLLLKREDGFDLLYSREDMAVDGYDLETRCFDVLEEGSLV